MNNSNNFEIAENAVLISLDTLSSDLRSQIIRKLMGSATFSYISAYLSRHNQLNVKARMEARGQVFEPNEQWHNTSEWLAETEALLNFYGSMATDGWSKKEFVIEEFMVLEDLLESANFIVDLQKENTEFQAPELKATDLPSEFAHGAIKQLNQQQAGRAAAVGKLSDAIKEEIASIISRESVAVGVFRRKTAENLVEKLYNKIYELGENASSKALRSRGMFAKRAAADAHMFLGVIKELEPYIERTLNQDDNFVAGGDEMQVG